MQNVWLKRILIFIVIISLLSATAFGSFVIGVMAGAFSQSHTGELSEELIAGEEIEEKIGILRLEGLVLSSGSEGPLSTRGVFTANQVKRWLREIAKDKMVKGIVIEVNSPGGSPVASDEIYNAIQKLRKTGRSVVVVMEDVGASGAYYFASAADSIIANPATLTGSIGVISEITNIQELLAKIGVNVEVYKSGEFKDLTSMYRERTDEEKALIEDYITAAYDLFITRVAAGRGIEEKKVRELAKGQIYSGIKAKEVGLIDELGSVEDAVEKAKDLQNLSRAKIVRYRTESPLDLLLGRVGSALNPLAPLIQQLTYPGLKIAYLPAF